MTKLTTIFTLAVLAIAAAAPAFAMLTQANGFSESAQRYYSAAGQQGGAAPKAIEFDTR